tara:strand:+ start:442 stop:615 length:174 start_codon:yes stop_codon:yes gene_type:complete
MEAKLPMQPPNNNKKINAKNSCIKIFYFFLVKYKHSPKNKIVGAAYREMTMSLSNIN